MSRASSGVDAFQLVKLAQPLRVPISALISLSVVANLLTLTGSIFMLQVYDRVLTSRSVPTLVALTALAALLYAFFIAIETLRLRIGSRFAGLIDDGLADPLFRANVTIGGALQTMPPPLRDLETLKAFISSPAPFVLIDLPWVPIYLALIFALHPLLGMVAIFGAAVITSLLIVNEIHARSSATEAVVLSAQQTAVSEAARHNAESVRSMGMVSNLLTRWKSVREQLSSRQDQQADRLALYTSASKGFRYFLQSAVLAMGAYLVINGAMTGGLIIAASIISARALAPVEQAIAHWRNFVQARQAWLRISDLLRRSQEPSFGIELPLPQKYLTVTNLSTAPARAHRPLATGVAFALEAGDGLGIIGLSGSGKSSLARALVGVWPLITGHVRLDGSELAHFRSERIGASIGYLPQAVELFEGTVAENICRFAAGDVTQRVLEAARKAQVHELIVALPRGYDTSVGPQGSHLSAGQRQRIGLARALYGDPFLVVLDEPNANLDGDGEQALNAAILEARERGAIVVVVAHRPSAIVAVNKLLFMEQGRQASFGIKEHVMEALSPPRKNDVGDDDQGVPTLAANVAE